MSAPVVTTTTTVIVVGAGPSGLATAACLTKQSIPYVLLERDECVASLWQTKAYDRLHLHICKELNQLPHFPIPKHYPKYVPRAEYSEYLTNYAAHFNISPRLHRLVTLARYDDESGNWHVKAKLLNTEDGEKEEEYIAKFLVVATGEMTDPYIPELEGLLTYFPNESILHSTQFKSGRDYRDKNVLVIGYGNSGLEIALDLTENGARTSISVRGKEPAHMVTRAWVDFGLKMSIFLPESIVDSMLANLSKVMYSDLATKYGFGTPKEGPIAMMTKYGKYPSYDVGTVDKIRSGEIKVFPGIERIKDKDVIFVNGESHPFHAIIFATGFKRSTHKWLQGYDHYLLKDGMPKTKYPHNWKGENGFYSAGFGRRAIVGHGMDAVKIADDINSRLS